MKFLAKINQFFNSKGFVIFFFVAVAYIYGTKSDRYFGWTNEKVKMGEPIISDGAGYYCYLPQWFIYHTSNFEFVDSIVNVYPESKFGVNLGIRNAKNQGTNKYYTGTAVSLTPFFLIAHAQARINGDHQDGYSKPYLLWMNLGSIAYFIFGAIGFYLFFRRFAIDPIWIMISIAGIAFGTNISFYTNLMVPFAHVFSFATISWMLLFAKKWVDENSSKSLLLLCFFIGWTMIIRPTNVLPLLFVPFLFDSNQLFISRMKVLFTSHLKQLLFGIVIIGSFLFFQLWNTHIQTGKWLLNTYTSEGFDNWKNPEIFNVLFSWRKGLFIFTPILALLLPGVILLYFKKRRLFWGVVFFTSVFIYITSSWWCWWYGGGLGARPFIDVFLILFLPIVFLLHYSNRLFKVLIIGFIAFTCWMYQVYEFQMKHNIIHYENMNFQQFKTVFMKEDLRFGWFLHMDYDTIPSKSAPFPVINKFNNNSRSWKELFVDNPMDNPLFASKIANEDFVNSYLGARITCDLRLLTPETNPSYNIYLFQKDSVVFFQPIFLGPLVPDDDIPTTVSVDFTPRIPINEFDSIRVEFIEGNTSVKAKNFKIKFYSF